MGSSILFPDFAGAVAQEEGVSGSLLESSNNPFALELGDIGYGTSSAAGGNQLTNFPSITAAYAAFQQMFAKDVSGASSIYSPNQSIQDYMTEYTGGNANAGNTVASILGVPASTPISSVGGAGTAGSGGTLPLSNQYYGSTPSSISVGSTAGTPPQTGSGGSPAASDLGIGSGALPSWLIRAIAIIAGLILVAGAIYTLKSTQNVITNVKRGATRAAELAG